MSTIIRPPPQGAPKILTRVYGYNLRPIVLFTTFLAALWSLFGTVSYFRAAGVNNDQGLKTLGTFSIVFGALYAAICAIELFGFTAALLQQLTLVRIYAFASVLTSLLVAALGLLRVIIHFTKKDDILKACESTTEGATRTVYPYGFFGPVYHDVLSASETRTWCKNSWDHDSWADIIGMLITILLAGMFTALSFSYYRQLQDPASVINRTRAPIINNNNAFNPGHYNVNMPYGSGGAPGSQPYFAPPPGPPPQQRNNEEYGKGGYRNDDEATLYGDYGDHHSKKDREDPFEEYDSARK